MKKYVVYKITNLVNSKIYIGIHSTINVNDSYLGSGTNLKKDIKKYGKSSFKKEILYIYDNEEDMVKKEIELVNEDFVKRLDTYNVVVGGHGFNMHNRVTVQTLNGEYLSVEIDDPRIKTGELKYLFENKLVAKDENGIIYHINKDDERYLKGDLIHLNNGKTVVKDKEGNIHQIDSNDIRIKSGEFVGVTKNTIVVKDKEGNAFRVDKDDERLKGGELVGITKGFIMVKDINENIMQVSKDDPRFLSGELIHITNGRKGSKEERLKKKKARQGKIIIHNDNLNIAKMINKNELEKYKLLGWKRGRLKK